MIAISKGMLRLLASYIAIPLVLILMPVFLLAQNVSVFDELVEYIMGGVHEF